MEDSNRRQDWAFRAVSQTAQPSLRPRDHCSRRPLGLPRGLDDPIVSGWCDGHGRDRCVRGVGVEVRQDPSHWVAGVASRPDFRPDQPTSKRRQPCGATSSTSTEVTRAARGPRRHHSTIASTAFGSPSNHAETVPSSSLRAHPVTPRAWASHRHVARKDTPWTYPRTRTCRAITAPSFHRAGSRPLRARRPPGHEPRRSSRLPRLSSGRHDRHPSGPLEGDLPAEARKVPGRKPPLIGRTR